MNQIGTTTMAPRIEVAEHGLDGAEAQIVYPPEQLVYAVEDIVRRDTERGQHDTNDDREHDQANQNA